MGRRFAAIAAVHGWRSNVSRQLVTPGHYTARIDLADALIREVVENRHPGQVVEAITTEGTPTFVDVLRREAFGRAER